LKKAVIRAIIKWDYFAKENIMNIRKITSVAAAAVIITPVLSGCTLFGKRKEYKTAAYSFTVPNSLKMDDTETEDDGSITCYNFSGGDFKSLSVYDTTGFSPRVSTVQLEYNVAQHLKSVSYINLEYDEIKLGDLNCYTFSYTDPSRDKDKGKCRITYEIINENISLTAAAYYDSKDEKSVKKELEKIMKSAEYISDYRVPTEIQNYECEYFKIDYDPKWNISYNKESFTDREPVSVKFSYRFADDVKQIHRPKLEIKVENSGGNKTAEQYAQETADNYGSSVSSEEILGFPAYKISHYSTDKDDPDDYSGHKNYYYFDFNGVVYEITAETNFAAENEDADIQELISCIELTEFSQDEISNRQQDFNTAAFTDYTFSNASFTIDSRLKPYYDDINKYDSFTELSGDYFKLEINNDVFADSVHDALITEYEDKADYFWWLGKEYGDFSVEEADFQTQTVTVGAYEAELLTYKDNNGRFNSVYFISVDGHIWRFEFSCYERDKDEMQEIIDGFFNSLTFSE